MSLSPIKFFRNLTFDVVNNKCISQNINFNPFICNKCQTPLNIYKDDHMIEWGVCHKCYNAGFVFDFYANYENIAACDGLQVLNLLFQPMMSILPPNDSQLYRMVKLYKIRQNISKTFTNTFDSPYIAMTCEQQKLSIPPNIDGIRDFINTTTKYQLNVFSKKNAFGEYIPPQRFDNRGIQNKKTNIVISESQDEVLLIPLKDLPEKHNGYIYIDYRRPKQQQIIITPYTHLTRPYESINAGFICHPHYRPDISDAVLITNKPMVAIQGIIDSWTELRTNYINMPLLGYFDGIESEDAITTNWNMTHGVKKLVFIYDGTNPNIVKTAVEQDGYIYLATKGFSTSNYTQMWHNAVTNAIYWPRFLAQRYTTTKNDFDKLRWLAKYGIFPGSKQFNQFMEQTMITPPKIDFSLFEMDPKLNFSYFINNNQIFKTKGNKVTHRFIQPVLPYVFQIRKTDIFFTDNKKVKTEQQHVIHVKYNNLNFTFELNHQDLTRSLKQLIHKNISERGEKCPDNNLTNNELIQIHGELFNIDAKKVTDKLGWDNKKQKFRFKDFSISNGYVLKEEELSLPTTTLLDDINIEDTEPISFDDICIVRNHKNADEIINVIQHAVAMCAMLTINNNSIPHCLSVPSNAKEFVWPIFHTLGMCFRMPCSIHDWVSRELRNPLRLRLYGEVNFPLYIPSQIIFSQIIAKKYDIATFGVIASQLTTDTIIHGTFEPTIQDTYPIAHHQKLSAECLYTIRKIFIHTLRSITEPDTDIENIESNHIYDYFIEKIQTILKQLLNKRKIKSSYINYANPIETGLKLMQHINTRLGDFQISQYLNDKDHVIYTAIDVNRTICLRTGISNELKIPSRLVELGIAEKSKYRVYDSVFPCLTFNKDIMKVL